MNPKPGFGDPSRPEHRTVSTHTGPIVVVLANGDEHDAVAQLTSRTARGLTSWDGTVTGDLDWFDLFTRGEAFGIHIGDRAGQAFIQRIDTSSSGAGTVEYIHVVGSGPPPF